MSLPFNRISPHLRVEIAQKLESREFVRFAQSSMDGLEISQSIRKRVTWARDEALAGYHDGKIMIHTKIYGRSWYPIELPFRLVVKLLYFDPFLRIDAEFVEKFVELFSITTSKTVCVHLMHGGVDASLTCFNDLLKATKAQEILIAPPCRTEILKFPAALQVIKGRLEITDDLLVKLKASEIRLTGTNITSQGLNAYLKDCISGERELNYLSIVNRNTTLDHGEVLAGYSYAEVPDTSLDRVFKIHSGEKNYVVTVGERSVIIELQHTSSATTDGTPSFGSFSPSGSV